MGFRGKIKRLLASPQPTRPLGRGLAVTVKGLMRTTRVETRVESAGIDPRQPDVRGHFLFLFWHEYILLPFYLGADAHISMLLSRNADAEILAYAADYMGFGVLRGSSYRGGHSALRQMLAEGRHRHLTMTPDGPRGPRRRLASGAIFLSSRLQMPIVPLGVGYDRPWRLKSWDRFAIPRPFSQVRMIFGSPVMVPVNLSRDELPEWREQIRQELARLSQQAERWASQVEIAAAA